MTEIVRLQKIFAVPDVAPDVLGVINLRGKVIPLLDVRANVCSLREIHEEKATLESLQDANQRAQLINTQPDGPVHASRNHTMNTLGTIYAPPLLTELGGLSDHPTLHPVVKIEVPSACPSLPSHRFYVSTVYCRMIGLGRLGEADALAQLRGLVTPGLPCDLESLFPVED